MMHNTMFSKLYHCIFLVIMATTSKITKENCLRKGDSYPNLITFTQALREFQNETRQYYVICGSRTLASYPIEGANLACVYQYVKYACKYCKNRHKKEQLVYHEGSRETKTIKCDCESFIYLGLDSSFQNLIIKQLNLTHTGHEGSEEFYDLLPENRRLDSEALKLVHQYWSLQVPRQIIIDEVSRLKKITMTSKDLDNAIRKFKDGKEDRLKSAVNLLKIKYRCNVSVVINKKTDINGHLVKEFKCLYFSTEKMRKALSSWPEIVFIDGTYKLLKKKLVVFVLAIQDSNRMTQIVGMGLLIDETKETVKEFLECFKRDHGNVCSKIRLFMSDKDLTERDVIKELFPWVELLLCEFHVLRIFSRTISTTGMGLKKGERLVALSYLDRMTKSLSEEQYLHLYLEFCNKVPDKVVQYFDKNWHGIRQQWTRYGMSQCNLGNYTNNCVESINARLKGEINAYSSFTAFVTGFFRFYDRRNRIIRFFLKDQYYKHPLQGYKKGSPEYDYTKLLTAPAAKMVLQQLARRKPMTLYNVDEPSQTSWIQSGFVMLRSSVSMCDCTEFTSHNLPCRHIFAVRDHFGINLFSPDLCAERWTKKYDKEHQPMLDDGALLQNISDHVQSMIVCKDQIDDVKKMSAKQRQKIIFDVAKNLADVGANTSGTIFQKRVQLLQFIMDGWLQNIEVDTDRFCREYLAKSAMHEETIEGENIMLKPSFKTPSRAKHLKKCTVKFARK